MKKIPNMIEWLPGRARVWLTETLSMDFFSSPGRSKQVIPMITLAALIVYAGIWGLLNRTQAQTVAGTTLTLQANYDDGTAVVGTVTLTGSKLNQAPALLTSGALSATGAYSYTLASGMDASTLYVIDILVPNPSTTPPGTKQIYECPFMLLGMNSTNLKGMHTVIVFYKTVPASGAFIKTETDSIDKAWL